MPLAQDQVEGQYNDNSFRGGDATKPSITASQHYRSDRSEIFRDLPVLGRHSAAVPPDNHWEFNYHCDSFSSGRVRSANYVIPCQYVVFSGKGPATTRNNERCTIVFGHFGGIEIGPRD
jgi:hypothetical protein